MDYLDFEIEIEQGADRLYRVDVLRSPAGETAGVLRLPFEPAALPARLQGLQLALLRSALRQRAATTPREEVALAFGGELFRALFDGEVATLFEASRAAALERGAGLRVKLRTAEPEIATLPWEFMFDGARGDYLALSASTPLIRYVPLPQAVEPLRVRSPLRILGLVASPDDLPTLDTERERQRLEIATESARASGALELTWLPGASWRYLAAAMRKGPWHVFHFIGHGGFDPTRREGLIVLAGDDGKAQPLWATDLARLLGDHHALRLAVLNACDGARGDGTDLFSGTAAAIVRGGTPSVVAMQYEISDPAAIEFSRSFYDAIADGTPVDAAVAEARKGMSIAIPNTLEWGTPVLFMRSNDGVLFSMSRSRRAGAKEPAKDAAAAPAVPAAGADVCPFRGLEAFDEADAAFFLGRETLTGRLLDDLREHRFLAVVGPSGSGKSSLVRAGMIPSLRRGLGAAGGDWPVAVVRPGARPIQALATQLATHFTDGEPQLAVRDRMLAMLLAGQDGLAVAVDAALANAPADRRFVLVVDQFEELFSICRDAEERRQFSDLLLGATGRAADRVVVIATMRADFYGRCAALPNLAARLSQRTALVPPMSATELRRAITAPAELAGLEFDRGLVDQILTDMAGEESALPLLQHTLLELWEGRDGHRLTVARYEEIGGLKGAIAQRAEKVYESLSPEQQRLARRVLLRLTQPGQGTLVTKRRASLEELEAIAAGTGDADAIVQRLTDARLLTTSRDDTGTWVDVSHEAVIANWPRLRAWIDENPARLRVHRRVTDGANEWAAASRDPSYLFTGGRLQEARQWAAANPEDANATELAFIEASEAAAAREGRSRTRRRRITVGGIAAALVAALVGGFVVLYLKDEADSASRYSDFLNTVSAAQATLTETQGWMDENPFFALQSAVRGLRLQDQVGFGMEPYRDALWAALATGRTAKVGATVEGVIPSADRRFAILDTRDGASIVRLADGATIVQLPASVQDVDVGPPGANVVWISYEDGTNELRRLDDGEVISLSGTIDKVFSGDDPIARLMLVEYAPPAGATPVEPGEDPFVHAPPAELRSLEDGRIAKTLRGPAGSAELLRGPGVGEVVVQYADDTAELVRMTDGSHVAEIEFNPRSPVSGPAVVLETTKADGDCATLRTSDGALIDTRNRNIVEGNTTTLSCGPITASADGTFVVVGIGPTYSIRRVDGWREIGQLGPDLSNVAFSAPTDPSGLVAVYPDRVELVRLADGTIVRSIPGTGQEFGFPPELARFSGDGRYGFVVVDGEGGLYDLTTGEPVHLPAPDQGSALPDKPPSAINGVEFSSDEDGTYAFVSYSGGDPGVLVNLRTSPPSVVSRHGQIDFWPARTLPPMMLEDSADTRLVDFRAQQVLARIPRERTHFLHGVIYADGDEPGVAILNFSCINCALGKLPPSAVLTREGQYLELPAEVVDTSFSPAPNETTFVAEYRDGRSDVFSMDGGLRRLVKLGLGVEGTSFGPHGDYLLVWYTAGESYVLDLGLLHSLPADPSGMSDDDMIATACGQLNKYGAAGLACLETP